MSSTEVAEALSGHMGSWGNSPKKYFHGGPDKRTPKQVVTELGLEKGHSILMPDGVRRKIRRVTNNGEVFVSGVRASVNVYTIVKDN